MSFNVLYISFLLSIIFHGLFLSQFINENSNNTKKQSNFSNPILLEVHQKKTKLITIQNHPKIEVLKTKMLSLNEINSTVQNESPVTNLPFLEVVINYPTMARKMGLEGKVILQYEILENLNIKAKILISSPYEILNRSALASIKNAKILRKTNGPQITEIHFKLKN